jgi:protein SCO1/2
VLVRRTLLPALGALALLLLLACGGGPRLTGTSLGNDPAPDFHLRDSSGQAYSLDQFRGHVVVLTFMYSTCPDYCPLEAELLRQADEAAGHPRDVVYLAVSVDPVGDTPQNIAKFEQEHQLGELGGRWHYLVGDPQELAAVWRSYYIGVTPGLPPGEAGHTSAIYFIDKDGRRRALSELDVRAEDLARDELLLARG